MLSREQAKAPCSRQKAAVCVCLHALDHALSCPQARSSSRQGQTSGQPGCAAQLQGLHACHLPHVLHEHKHERCLWPQARIVGGPALEKAAQSFPFGNVSRAGHWIAVLAAVAVHVRLHDIHGRCDGGCCQPCRFGRI